MKCFTASFSGVVDGIVLHESDKRATEPYLKLGGNPQIEKRNAVRQQAQRHAWYNTATVLYVPSFAKLVTDGRLDPDTLTLKEAGIKRDSNGHPYIVSPQIEDEPDAALILFTDYAPLYCEAELRVEGEAEQIAKAQFRYGRHNKAGGYHPYLYKVSKGTGLYVRVSGKPTDTVPCILRYYWDGTKVAFEKERLTKEISDGFEVLTY